MITNVSADFIKMDKSLVFLVFLFWFEVFIFEAGNHLLWLMEELLNLYKSFIFFFNLSAKIETGFKGTVGFNFVVVI